MSTTTTTRTRTRLAPSKSVSAFPSMAASAGPYSVSRSRFFPLDCWLVELRRIVLRQPESPRIAAALSSNASSAAVAALGLWPGQSAVSSAFCLILGSFNATLALVAYSTVFVRQRISSRNRTRKGSLVTESSADWWSSAEEETASTRFEVAALLAATAAAYLASLHVVKLAVWEIFAAPEVRSSATFPFPAFLTILANIILSSRSNADVNTALTHAIRATASDSWISGAADSATDYVRDSLPPAAANLLLPLLSRPMSVLCLICFAAVCAAEFVCHCGIPLIDPAAAVAIAALVVTALAPISRYTWLVMTRCSPSEVVPQLKRGVAAALDYDGITEFRNRHFFAISFGRLGGSLTIRVRDDVDDAEVLDHVTNSLAHIVWPLTVHISKDSVPNFDAHAHLMPRLRRQASRLIVPASESPSEVRGLSPVGPTATAALEPLLPNQPKATNGNGHNGHHSNGKSPLASPNFITSTPNTSPA